MPLPKDAFDQFRLYRRHRVPDLFEVADLQRLHHLVLDIVLPLNEVAEPHVPVHDILQPVSSPEAGEPAQAAGVFVLGVHRQPVLPADRIEEVHPLLILFVIHRADVHDGVQALPAAVHQDLHRQLQILNDLILRIDVLGVALDQCVPVAGYVSVCPALAVHGVETDPDARSIVVAAESVRDVIRMLPYAVQQLLRGPAGGLSVGFPFPIFVLVCRIDIADLILRFKQCAQVIAGFLGRVECILRGRRHHGFCVFLLPPAGVDRFAVISDHVIPPVGLQAVRPPPAVFLGHVIHGSHGDLASAVIAEGLPFPFALAGMIPRAVRLAPLVPEAAGQALLVEGRAYICPFLIAERPTRDMPQQFPGLFRAHHQKAPFLNAFFGASSSLSKNFFSLLLWWVFPSRPSYSST